MPELLTKINSEYNQSSFIGGMNLLGDDSRLTPSQYRIGFDLTNRYDTLDPVLVSQVDTHAPVGVKQALFTFGNYVVLFCAGSAYYRLYSDVAWTKIEGFAMSPTAPRYWVIDVPVATTNYLRYAQSAIGGATATPNPSVPVNVNQVAGASEGNLPGLLVQDNINQPLFLFLDVNGYIQCRKTQTYEEWMIQFTDKYNTTVGYTNNFLNTGATYALNGTYQQVVIIAGTYTLKQGANDISWSTDGVNFSAVWPATVNLAYQQIVYFTGTASTAVTVVGTGAITDVTKDKREYVPIGNSMAWVQGILFIVSQDYNTIYRSVSGRPLDFVVNVTNNLSTNTTAQTVNNTNGVQVTIPPFTQIPGGDATTTSYAVGVGGISCVRPLSTGGLFVAAGNANFAVTLNQTPNAPTIFGEYLFNRSYLFEATCLSDRAIMDTVGDTRFIDLTGVRSFNAIAQTQNEGRNNAFTATIQAAFGNDTNPIIQSADVAACILFNNYELYAVNTIFGYAIAKYDTINSCWTSFDIAQTNGVGIKRLAKIELGVRQLYAVTTDDKVYTLYVGPGTTTPMFRTCGVCSSILYADSNIKMNNPRNEVKLMDTRIILNKITADATLTFTPYVNNRISQMGTLSKTITYSPPVTLSNSPYDLPDINTALSNQLFSTPDCEQGWKVFGYFTWSQGSVTQFSMQLLDNTPMQPLCSQENTD